MWLPLAEARAEPRAAVQSASPLLRPRRAADLPPLADVSALPAPAPRQLAPGPLAAAPSPNLDVVPILPLRQWPHPDRVWPAPDPTEEQSRQAVVSAVPPQRQSLAPFIRLTIPDPLESVRPVRLARPPADGEPPVHVGAPPLRPVLPAK